MIHHSPFFIYHAPRLDGDSGKDKGRKKKIMIKLRNSSCLELMAFKSLMVWSLHNDDVIGCLYFKVPDRFSTPFLNRLNFAVLKFKHTIKKKKP